MSLNGPSSIPQVHMHSFSTVIYKGPAGVRLAGEHCAPGAQLQ